jgi:outer membrane protein assembly factor BamA
MWLLIPLLLLAAGVARSQENVLADTLGAIHFDPDSLGVSAGADTTNAFTFNADSLQSDSLDVDISEGLAWTDWQVASLRVTGLEHVQERAVVRELEMHPGDPYTDSDLVVDANAIKNTHLFARLVVTVSPDSVDEAVHVTYALKERPRFLFLPLLSPGQTAGEWDYGLALQHNNVSGLGRRLNLEAKDGSSRRLAITWLDPWLWNRRLQWLLQAEYSDSIVRRSRKVYKPSTRASCCGWQPGSKPSWIRNGAGSWSPAGSR